jgi:hypothetical protein
LAPGWQGSTDGRLEPALACRDHAGMADVFISYTQSDRDWAFWIAKELKELGHKPHIHEWEIKGGEDIYAWMETRIDAPTTCSASSRKNI